MCQRSRRSGNASIGSQAAFDLSADNVRRHRVRQVDVPFVNARRRTPVHGIVIPRSVRRLRGANRLKSFVSKEYDANCEREEEMANQEQVEISQEAITALANNGGVRWFVDANVVISGDAKALLGDREDVLATSEVVAEVRKRPECKAGNEFIDRVVCNGNVIAIESFQSTPASFEFILSCAQSLAPAIRVRKQELMDRDGLLEDDAEVHAIEMIANEGWFFECEMKNDAVKRGLMTEEEAQIDKSSRRSWFKYPKKRRDRQIQEYMFSDESMLAIAIANSILKNQKTCVLSNDTDCVAIMKQFADNLIWAASAMECELSFGRIELAQVASLWERRCEDLNKYRQSQTAKRMMSIIEAGEYDPARAYEPIENEVWSLYGPTIVKSHTMHFRTRM